MLTVFINGIIQRQNAGLKALDVQEFIRPTSPEINHITNQFSVSDIRQFDLKQKVFENGLWTFQLMCFIGKITTDFYALTQQKSHTN